MTLPDQLSEASKQQLAKQIEFFQALTSRAFDNAERILALNIQATRATLDHTSGAVRQLAQARNPRDFAALGAQSQQQMEAVIAYGRKLMEITNKPAATPPPAASAPASTSAAAPEEHIVTAPPVMVDEPAAPAPVAAAESYAESNAESVSESIAESVADFAPAPAPAELHVPPSAHPLGEAEPAPAPVPAPAPAPAPIIAAKPTPIAQAVGEVIAAPLEAPHPAAMPIQEPDAGPIAIPAIAPIDATPAHAAMPVDGGGPVKRAKGAKKR
jgi:phasin family protein